MKLDWGVEEEVEVWRWGVLGYPQACKSLPGQESPAVPIVFPHLPTSIPKYLNEV